jgi:hypothetical protein
MWRHPKYYAELRKQARLQARKLTSSQATSLSPQAHKPKAQASSQSSQAQGSPSQGTSKPSPCSGYKQQE